MAATWGGRWLERSLASIRDVHDSRASRRWWPWAAVTVVALVGAVALNVHVWTLSSTRATTCSCADASLTTWFLEWPWAAIRQGHAIWFSRSMFFPQGTNLLSNTGYLAIGVVSLPLTALFGPLATFNTWLVLGPTLTTLAMTRFATRFTTSFGAAAIAGLFFGFAPLVIYSIPLGHLNMVVLAGPPLIATAWWDFLRSPSRRGAFTLAAWFIIQFFVSTEIFAICVIASVLFLTLSWPRRTERTFTSRDLIRAALPGVVALAGVLALPTYYALHGPSSYQGAIWGGSLSTASVAGFFFHSSHYALWWPRHRFLYLPPTYLSPGLLALSVVLWRRARGRALVVAAGLLVGGSWLALGSHYWYSAWHWIGRIGPLVSLVNERFAIIEMMGAALIVALGAQWIMSLRIKRLGRPLVVVVLAAVLAPYLVNITHGAPYQAQRVWEPTWFKTQAATLPPHDVVLAFPFFNTSANYLSVQALHQMSFDMVGGTSPQWLPSRQGFAQPGYTEIWRMANGRQYPNLSWHPTPQEIHRVQSALRYWHVNDVVIPFDVGPTTSRAARAPLTIALWMVGILGQPRQVAGAWVWHYPHGYGQS